MTPRDIVWHCDADAFFAACHVATEPTLGGRPLVVGGDPKTRHGIVLTATYEARRFGVKTAMPLGQALRLCPELTVLPPNGVLYQQFSQRLRGIWDEFSPLVEPASIDEAWLDVGRGALSRFGDDPVAGARALKERVRQELSLTVSVGVSTNKMLAKQASDMDKPDGLTVLFPSDVPARLWPLDVGALYGIGPRRAERLRGVGIHTIGDLAQADHDVVIGACGSTASLLQTRAQGVDETPVRAPVAGEEQSISVERTLPRDVASVEDAEPYLLALAEQLASRLARHGRWGQTVILKYKTAAFVLHTRQTTLPTPTRDRDRLYRAACALFKARPHGDAVRLLGLGVSHLKRAPGDLFETDRAETLDRVVESIRQRYGQGAIGTAGSARLTESPSTFRHNEEEPPPSNAGRPK